MRRGDLPGSTAMTFRSSTSCVMRPPCGIWCVSKLTCSRGLEFFSVSKIHCRASPRPFGRFGSDSVFLVRKLDSFVSSCCRRSADTEAISFWIRGSSSPPGAAAVCAAAVPVVAKSAASTVAAANAHFMFMSRYLTFVCSR